MWFLLLLYTAHIEQVFSQGDVNRLILKNGNNPCEGHIEIYHDNKWGYVGDTKWDEKTEKVVCRNAHCGEPQSTEDIHLEKSGTVWLNEMTCTGNEKHLWDCAFPGWNISIYRKDSLKKIKCKNQIKISLDGFKCAGNVQYSINGRKSGYFCADNWGQQEAGRLCQSLGCGTVKEIPEHEWIVSGRDENLKNMMIDCSGFQNVDNLWQCVTTTASCSKLASVICTGHKRVQLKGNTPNVCHGQLEIEKNGKWHTVTSSDEISPDALCEQMYCGASANHSLDNNSTELNCTDNVKVVLMDNGKTSRCYGEVHIALNDLTHPVCASTWTSVDAEVVCRELNCGKVISKDARSNNKAAIMDNVKCSGKESSLWHCRAKHDKPFECSFSAYVVCADSVNVRLKDGPGTCAGRVEIQYEGKWQRAVNEGWTSDNSNTVCKQLKCGDKSKPTRPNKFNQGSADFLAKTVNCASKATHISECITENNRGEQNNAVPLTCLDHKVVFLNGNNSCSGTVGIEHMQKTYWLSGSNETWNQESANTVCQQMHCGEASNYTSIQQDDKETTWRESYKCSSKTTSLFECENMTQPPDHNDTIASVTCTGSVTVNLTNGCWGNVNVCVGGKCGGVCKDAWSDEKSDMLCENLGCGHGILASSTPVETEVIIRSMHTTKHTTNLNQCNLVRNDDGDTTCNKKPGYVVCSGSVKIKMNSSRYKCSGNVEMMYENQWLPVCSDALTDIETRNTICEELKCGQAIKKLDFGSTSPGTRGISKIQCSTNGTKPLAACNITSDKCTGHLGGLQCSEWRKMELRFGKACSGDVFVRSEGKWHAVSSEGWTDTEGNQLCKDLNCGSVKQNNNYGNKTNDPFWSKNFNCTDVARENIWDCENSPLHSEKKQLHIECQGEPNINLSENCSGEVKINNVGICINGWNLDYSHSVCQEQKCGNAIGFEGKPANPDNEYYSVSCEGYHHKLGQCNRLEVKCEELVSVYCTGNVKFRTTENCGGVIEVNYRNKWENVHIPDFTPQITDELCQAPGCRGRLLLNDKNIKKVNLETALNCTKDHKDIKYCVSHIPNYKQVKPSEIYCEGYVQTPTPPTARPPTFKERLPVIIGVGFSLLLVILTVLFVRVCIVKKAKNPRNVSSILSRKEVEFESGDYEDVASVANAREDFNHGRFPSEADVIAEGEARSTSSFPYDDIDEAVEARPLTSPTATAGARDDKYVNQSVLNSSSDVETYEVDDPQENYDDIEACPKITQTKAEVYDSSQTAPDSIAVTPPGLVKGGEDYLVPGQDG
uniref:scavenger receptor cysteine-rich type 1 protein M160 n=1 Tax=Scatophagus argus TaxID=75038 RepID=UPI001ED814B8|nr:scavenger receptor cysteine-rich type 1 protein M160 [Scatophagus argus]